VIAIRVRTEPDLQRLSGMLGEIQAAARNIRPALPAIVAVVKRQFAHQFESEGARSPSGRWQPLSPRYAAWKARRHPGAKILERTGALKRSLTSYGAGSIVTYGANSVFIGSSMPYGPYHQTGTRNMPRRAPIEPTDRDVKEWVVVIRDYFERVGSRAGFTGRFAGAMR